MSSSAPRKKILAALCAVAALALVIPASSQETKRDPKVQALFDQSVAAYKALTALQEKITFRYTTTLPELLPGAQPDTMELKAQKPNKIALAYSDKTSAGKITKHQVVSDGSNLWTWHGDTNAYTKMKAPPKFPTIPDILNVPELDLFLRGQDPFLKLPIPATLLTVGKPIKLGEIDVDVVEGKVSQTGVPITGTFRMFFGQKDHLVHGIVFEGGGLDSRDGKQVSFKIEAVYLTVNPSPTLTDKDFSFTPPDGAKLEQPAPAVK
jgi:outer membrane lipoprotein-sorting protein